MEFVYEFLNVSPNDKNFEHRLLVNREGEILIFMGNWEIQFGSLDEVTTDVVPKVYYSKPKALKKGFLVFRFIKGHLAKLGYDYEGRPYEYIECSGVCFYYTKKQEDMFYRMCRILSNKGFRLVEA